MNAVLAFFVCGFYLRASKKKVTQLTEPRAHGCLFGNRASPLENSIGVFVHGAGLLVNRWNYGYGNRQGLSSGVGG